MDSAPQIRRGGNGGGSHEGSKQPLSRNRQWVATENGQRSGSSTPYHSDGERWDRGVHRGGHRGRLALRSRGKFPNVSLRVAPSSRTNNAEYDHESLQDGHLDEPEPDLEPDDAHGEEHTQVDEPGLDSQEEREKFYQALVKAREVERKKAISEGKMDDPTVPKRLEDAICVVGTCQDMCPRFERYRRERENNLAEWEMIPGTKRVDHKRAVKMYERAAGDKTLPSDLRPPDVLKRTLDYLFHDLLPRGGFSPTFAFIRDRSRAVRNDFTMQHSYGPEAIECHDRCARFHILALHFERDTKVSLALEEQQLMNTLQSLKEFYEDQRDRYESPTELEMRVYHRLIHIRDQKERHEDIPEHITSHPVFRLTTDFRLHVQRKSAPITKTSSLIVDAEGMQIFGNLANVLREQGSVVMIYLVACILERLFGKDAIDDIEAIRGDLSVPDIIDGVTSPVREFEDYGDNEMQDQDLAEDEEEREEGDHIAAVHVQPPPSEISAFSNILTAPNVFNNPSPFGVSAFPSSSIPLFGVPATSVFGMPASAASQVIPSSVPPPNIFGTGPLSFPSLAPHPTINMIPSEAFAPPHLQSNLFNIAATPSLTTEQIPTFSNSLTSLTPTLDGTTITTALTPPPPNGAQQQTQFNDSTGSTAPIFNSIAPSFMPTLTPSKSPPPIFDASPRLFERSSNPSPSSLPPDNNAPSTPVPPPTSSSPSHSFNPLSSAKKNGLQPQALSTTPPVLPRINTSISSTFLGTPATPVLPPPLPKHKPISLPSTPSINAPSKPLLNFLKGNLATPTSSLNQELLSPLVMASPTAAGPSMAHSFPSSQGSSSKGSTERLSSGKRKKPAKTSFIKTDPRNLSLHFAQRSLLVKSSFQRWHHRITERVAWVEACQQSDAYKQKIKYQQNSPTALPDKKRRISSGYGTVVPSPLKKRARRRVSTEYHPPRTDEELARRFKENHEEHERRWAQGSFLKTITDYVKAKLGGTVPHDSWRLWLSMNPDSDATAIWLERKFEVPDSGGWVSEAVFSIPLNDPSISDSTGSDSPGIIVFECTPLEAITDDLERKYRILDDCSRLRDLVDVLPLKRHFIPSLLIISWPEGDQGSSGSEFSDMVKKLLDSRTINGYNTLSITSATIDLDGKLQKALQALSLDLEGKLVRGLNIQETFKLFEPAFMSFISEWMENCSVNGQFDWYIFGQVVQAAVALSGMTVHSISGLLSVVPQVPFPTFDSSNITDNESAYRYVTAWLAAIGGSTESITFNLQTHKEMGHDFPARDFIQGLWDLTQIQAETRWQKSQTKLYIPICEIDATLEAQSTGYEPHRTKLGKALHMCTRRSPKRRSTSIDTLESSQSKRQRYSSPINDSLGDITPLTGGSPYLNGHASVSPTSTHVSLNSSDEPPIVTIAMLRALTQDIRKKYGSV